MAAARIAGVVMVTVWLAGCGGGTDEKPSGDRFGLGATLGALLGSETGRALDDKDRALSADAEYDALQYGQPGTAREWKNPQNGHSGSVTPGPAYSVNQYTCRDYTHKVVLTAAKQEVVRSTACRQPDGSWRPLQ
jgi:surface antigen